MTAFRILTILFVAPLSLFAVTAPAVASLEVHPTSYSLEVAQGGILEVPLHITNIGPASPLGFTVTDDRPWLAESPTSGQIARGDTVEVTVTVDATGLAAGDYSGTITVTDPHHGPIPIPVLLTVQGVGGVEGTSFVDGWNLAQSSPHPMIDAVEIDFAPPGSSLSSFARLRVFDAHGREVALLFSGPVRQTQMRIQWDGVDRAGRQVPSGTYFYALEGGGRRIVRRLIKIR